MATPVATPTEIRPDVEVASRSGWRETVRALPTDVLGAPDWMAALRSGQIAPRGGREPKSPPLPILDLDVELDPGIPDMKVIFPHSAHTEWLQCANCHPHPFAEKAGAADISMGEIFAGQWCGKCHGKVAFGLTGCPRCHTELSR